MFGPRILTVCEVKNSGEVQHVPSPWVHIHNLRCAARGSHPHTSRIDARVRPVKGFRSIGWQPRRVGGVRQIALLVAS